MVACGAPRLTAVARSKNYAKNADFMHVAKSPYPCTGHRVRAAAAAAMIGLAALMLQSGCVESTIAAAGVTAGFGLAQGQAESFIRGELKSARQISLDEARAAIAQAMNDLQLPLLKQVNGQYDGLLVGRAPGGREIKVYLKADSPVMTRFSIRVGMMGDSSVSQLVMARIDAAIDANKTVSTSQPALN